MSKKRFVFSGIILVLLIMTMSIYLTIQKDEKNLDSWIGEYSYVAVIPHNSGLLNYIIEYNINIYKQDKEYYAKIANDGWQTQVRTLASVKGNEEKIDIIFLGTLPDDHIYDSERYDAGEVLLQFQRDGTGIITVWKAMKMENPVLSEMDGDVIGKYFCCEPISEELLAVMENVSGNQMESWLYVDMDHDGTDELIGVFPDESGHYQTWYCSSDGNICDMVYQNSDSMDGCKLEPLDLGDRTHVAIDAYRMFGTVKNYSIIALDNEKVSFVVSDNYGYAYMSAEGDILLDVEAYDGMYDPDIGMIMHTWNDTYLFFDGNEYKEYGATEISVDEFFCYNNAQELYDLSRNELWQDDTVSIEYTYYRRSNGIIHIQCDVYSSTGYILYGYYTVRYSGMNLLNELGTYNNGQMYPYFSNLEVVYSSYNEPDMDVCTCI